MEILPVVNANWPVISFIGFVLWKLAEHHFKVKDHDTRLQIVEKTQENHAESLSEIRDLKKDITYIKEGIRELKEGK